MGMDFIYPNWFSSYVKIRHDKHSYDKYVKVALIFLKLYQIIRYWCVSMHNLVYDIAIHLKHKKVKFKPI